MPESLRSRLTEIVKRAELELDGMEKKSTSEPIGELLRPHLHTKTATAYPVLDELLEEARAGAPDIWLAKKASTSVGMVRRWRAERGIKRSSGRRRQAEVTSYEAIDPYGDRVVDYLQRAADSPIGGCFVAPEYVARKPLNYDEFCRLVTFLHHYLGIGPDLLGEALGIRPQDVEIAIRLQTEWLDTHGEPCAACGRLTDIRYGRFCSTVCKRK